MRVRFFFAEIFYTHNFIVNFPKPKSARSNRKKNIVPYFGFTQPLVRDTAKTLPAVKVGRENRIAKSQLIDYLQQKDRTSSNPRVYFLEKTFDNVWTCKPTCDIVHVGKNKKE